MIDKKARHAALAHADSNQFFHDLARIAKVVPEKRDQFDEAAELAIDRWQTEVELADTGSQLGPSGKVTNAHSVLLEMRRCADLLIEYLERARSFDDGDLWLSVALKLSPSHEVPPDIYPMLRCLNTIRQAITKALDFNQIKGYRGLAGLVFRLELAAQNAGGKFTAHKKYGNKGSLLSALDRLRKVVAARSGDSLVECLPKPTCHPVSEYERLLTRAREEIAAKRMKLNLHDAPRRSPQS